MPHDIVISGGRVIDPETGHDGIANVAITAGTITAVTPDALLGTSVIDARGKIVAPGWIDLHSHAQSVAGLRLQAQDGVTTALELEAGALPVASAYEQAAAEGRPVNFGFAVSWQQARMIAVAGLDARGTLADALPHYGDTRWYARASEKQERAVFRSLEEGLTAGALGIGVLLGYAPGLAPEEYLRISRLAAAAGVPTFTHARGLAEHEPSTPIDGAEEIVRAAGETGVHAHYCHVNSTTLRHHERVLDLVDRTVRAGARVSTEAYPYGAGTTAISAAFLDPARLGERGISPSAIVYTPTGEVVADDARLMELRARDPGALAVVHYLDEDRPEDQAVLDRFLTAPDMVLASDALPLLSPELESDPYLWPIPESLAGHPRNGGTFSRFIRRYVRELGALSLLEAVRRCSYLPAAVLQDSVPSMRRKGRVSVGADADVVVFDVNRVSDRSTYSASVRPSVGYDCVLVGGEPVVVDDELVTAALPGRPVRR